MLKVIKSANKSAIDDAKDLNNTAVTLEGQEACDADDYGYVSHESNALYSKIMQKYGNETDDKFKFSKSKSNPANQGSIRDKLERTKSELRNPATTSKATAPRTVENKPTKAENEKIETNKSVVKPKPKIRKPPPLGFNELLKIAEKKQFEPIVVEVPLEPKSTERLMSKKEKLEHDERLAYIKRRKKERQISDSKTATKSTTEQHKDPDNANTCNEINKKILPSTSSDKHKNRSLETKITMDLERKVQTSKKLKEIEATFKKSNNNHNEKNSRTEKAPTNDSKVPQKNYRDEKTTKSLLKPAKSKYIITSIY